MSPVASRSRAASESETSCAIAGQKLPPVGIVFRRYSTPRQTKPNTVLQFLMPKWPKNHEKSRQIAYVSLSLGCLRAFSTMSSRLGKVSSGMRCLVFAFHHFGHVIQRLRFFRGSGIQNDLTQKFISPGCALEMSCRRSRSRSNSSDSASSSSSTSSAEGGGGRKKLTLAGALTVPKAPMKDVEWMYPNIYSKRLFLLKLPPSVVINEWLSSFGRYRSSHGSEMSRGGTANVIFGRSFLVVDCRFAC